MPEGYQRADNEVVYWGREVVATWERDGRVVVDAAGVQQLGPANGGGYERQSGGVLIVRSPPK